MISPAHAIVYTLALVLVVWCAFIAGALRERRDTLRFVRRRSERNPDAAGRALLASLAELLRIGAHRRRRPKRSA